MEYLGGDAPGYEILCSQRRVTDEGPPHGSGKADGVYTSVQITAAVVAVHPSGIRPLVI